MITDLRKKVLSLTLALTCAQGVHASCSSILKAELVNRVEESRLARNDLIGATIFSLPAMILFPPAVIFEGVAVGFKLQAVVKVKNAEQKLALYAEASSGGGKLTKRLFKKLKRTNPASELTYEQLLVELHAADEQELGCAPGAVQSNKDIITVIDARDI